MKRLAASGPKEAPVPEVLHRALLRAHPDALVCMRLPKGDILEVNEAFTRLLGLNREQAVGRSLDVMHLEPAHAQELTARAREALTTGKPVAHACPLRRGDGTSFPAGIRLTAVSGLGEQVALAVIQEAPAHPAQDGGSLGHALREILHVHAELASKLDLDGVAQAVTDAATAVSGARFGAFFYNVVDAQGESYTLYALAGAPREAFSQFSMPRNTEVFGPTFRGESIVRSDDITKDPRYGKNAPHRGMPEGHLPVRSYLAVPVVSRSGTVHGGIFLGHPEPGVFAQAAEDAVAAIAAQAAIAIDNALLYKRARESDERWKRLAEAAPVQIITIDREGRLLTINRSLRGLTEEQLRGGCVYDLIAPEDRERVREVIEGVMRTGIASEYETKWNEEEHPRWFHVHVAALGNPEEGAVLIVKEVTGRKEYEMELARIRSQLIQGEKLAALGTLVSGVAHELRTPLTFLANNVFLVQHRLDRAARNGETAADAQAQTAPFLSEIMMAVDRINLLVEDLRRYTRARRNPEVIVASLDVMVADAVELFRATHRGRHPIQTSLSPTRPVRGNKGEIQQLLLNLIQNAVEATPPDGVVRITTRDGQDGPVLEVHDQGPGIPDEVSQQMYESLFTTKAMGTGLGLSIVRRIVEEHEARIECETGNDRGTCFRIRFRPAPE